VWRASTLQLLMPFVWPDYWYFLIFMSLLKKKSV